MTPHILIAGIGNIFLGDDGFGVEVARRLAERTLPEGVRVADFGIRGMDLAYTLLDDYAVLIFVDAAPRGEAPGTLSLIEHTWDRNVTAAIDTHSMDPVKVLLLARELGAKPTPTYIVACEPAFLGGGGGFEDVVVALSEPVRAAVDEAVPMVESLVDQIVRGHSGGGEHRCGTWESQS